METVPGPVEDLSLDLARFEDVLRQGLQHASFCAAEAEPFIAPISLP